MQRKKRRRIKSNNKGYEAFLRNLKLFGLALTNSSCEVDRPTYFRLRDKKVAVRSVAANYELVRVEREFFNAVAKFKLTVDDKNRKERALTIQCTFQTHFHGKEPIDRTFAKQFTISELRLVIWPYFRQFVSDTTARMAIAPIVVPLSTQS